MVETNIHVLNVVVLPFVYIKDERLHVQIATDAVMVNTKTIASIVMENSRVFTAG